PINNSPPPPPPNPERKSSPSKLVLAVSIPGSALVLSLFCGISYITYKRMVNRRNNNRNKPEFPSPNTQTHINELLHLDNSKEDDREGIDVPYFDLQNIIEATNDFSEENQLGQGGFGPVYKGKLPGGEEIAVKRLSSLSGQGLQEFKNEVTVIAKLQHRNLTSNILLDEDMNPKISDFGLAKIVKGKDIEDITNRVVGTFGYMSPEYALDGVFSLKSDVFSFGVVLLEIISGKKNIGFYQAQKSISLLGHAWNLWREDKPFDLLDQTLMKSCNSSEVLKCINVGLLCVQGDPNDRPTMTNVIMMLGGDMATLPIPKEPAFIPRRDHAITSSTSSSKQDTQTKTMTMITEVAGR
ncbi:hypothetical protein M8C21_012981, partial [Ambrosia artemisiifolia]